MTFDETQTSSSRRELAGEVRQRRDLWELEGANNVGPITVFS
jgi:hypothetical protein